MTHLPGAGGAFAVNVLMIWSSRLPGWALPLAGGSLVTLIVVT